MQKDNPADMYPRLKRGPQTLLQKDIGLILAYTGVSDGWRVIEGGTGSGALTIYLANAVRPSGKVYSYDWRPEHQSVAKHNINPTSLKSFVVFKEADIYETDFTEKDVDMVTLDVAEPWHVYKAAKNSLRSGGFLVTFIPTYEQLKKCTRSLARSKFRDIKVVDCLLREYKAEENSTRPESTGIMHTGFLIFARK
ncbi:MAG: methyltransferase domain-containing protein [Candidatus Aenigmatarchaeota archaeon]|nr:MAG: methyltransferase domain-containing protein [Candidatus Aenigmarchaeota archaeon]